LNEIFDYKLIQAPVELKDGDTVLDSDTGTGMFTILKKGQPTELKKKHNPKVTGYSLYPNNSLQQ
jgi:hypothetical protein